MSRFGDIAEAYRRHAAAGGWEGVTYGLIYTCNCGWVDLGHLNPDSPRAQIGAANLWRAIRAGGPAVERYECSDAGMAQRMGMASLGGGFPVLIEPAHCHRERHERFADGQTGFAVTYRQDHGGYPGRPGVAGRYLVKHGLTLQQQRAVALAIFMQVSHDFERFQSGWPGRWLTDSGYSQEDLVSNLIGFTIAVGLVSKAEAIAACRPVSQATAERIWQSQGPVGANKNRRFEPVLLDSSYDDPLRRICGDDCAGAPRQFPAVFRQIRPARAGQEYRRLGAGPMLLP